MLGGARPAAPSAPAVDLGVVPAVLGVAAAAAAFAIAGRRRLDLGRGRRSTGVAPSVPLRRLQQLHRGGIGDSAAWLTFGTAAIGIVLALGIR